MKSKHIILIFFWILPGFLFGQFSFLDDPFSDIEVEFLREKIESEPEKSFFNVLKITNPTDRRLQFNANISLPRGWTLMGDKRKVVTLSPNDSILIPIRASIARDAKGDIGYAVVASLTDNRGQSFKNKYSFVNVPQKNKLLFRPDQRTYYFNNANNKTEIQFNCINKGNVDEVVYLEFTYDQGVKMPNGINETFKTEFLLPPNADTVLNYELEYLDKKQNLSANRKNYRVHLKTYTKDTVIQNAIWIKKITQEYENYIPDRNRLLIIELSALNIFSDYDPIYNGNLRGSFLTKNAGSVFYRFQTMGKNFSEDPWKYSRMRARYDYKNFLLRLGDISESIDQSLYGRGASAEIIVKKQELSVTATRNVFNLSDKVGALLKLKPYDESYFEAGGVLAQNPDNNTESHLAVMGFYIPFIKNITFYVRGGFSQLTFNDYNGKSLTGYGTQAQLSYKNKKFYYRNSLQWGDRQYQGYFGGNLKFYNQATYRFSERLNLSVNANIFNNNPPIFDGPRLAPDLYYNSLYSLAQLDYHLDPMFTLYGGPRQEIKVSNSFFNFDRERELVVPTTYLTGGVRIRSQKSALTANLRFAVGYSIVNVDPYATTDTIIRKSNHRYPSFELGAILRGRFWSVYASYYDGPYTMNQHFEDIYYGFENRLVRILPQIDLFLFRDFIKFSNRSTMSFDLASKTSRYNISSIVSAYPGKGWRLQLLNTIGYQSSYDKVVEEKYTFSNSYFEFRIQKKFGFNQPRVKYYDLNVVFFKDLNNDGVKGKDEPGIENVLAKIDVDHTINDSMSQISTQGEGGFYATELLSDIKGLMSYKNIPSGFYIIKYVSLGEMRGNFTSDKTSESIVMDEDKTIYIPFKESNKNIWKCYTK